jgi:glycosidase
MNPNAEGQAPDRLVGLSMPSLNQYTPSPESWQKEVLYFLLPDRFSDGQEDSRNLLDRNRLTAARPDLGGQPFSFAKWSRSGKERWQGGTLRGLQSKLPYLRNLGATTIWIGPVFRQRRHENTFHGYAIQDFLDVDPRLGTTADLIHLVAEAHKQELKVILDIIFNHSGPNWLYPPDAPGGPFTPNYTSGRYAFGAFRDADGQKISAITQRDQGVWPLELQDVEAYTRAGRGSLDAGDLDDPSAEHKRTDFGTLRDIAVDRTSVLTDLITCYQYWIALTDCDGFRIDTLKHVSFDQARNFCGAIKEFATGLGKLNFLLIGEIGGGDANQRRYADALGRDLNAALDIGDMRRTLHEVAKGLRPPSDYFRNFDPSRAIFGPQRLLGERHVSVLDDHDHITGNKVRFATGAASVSQVAAAVLIQLLTLGMPCIYYGTEQALGAPDDVPIGSLPGLGDDDRYLREAMFGPLHPRRSGAAGIGEAPATRDPDLPGFGAFGTAGQHCFDANHPVYRTIRAACNLRLAVPTLVFGRQYQRETSFLGKPFDFYGGGEVFGWSRILNNTEFLCVYNSHGTAPRGADVTVDTQLTQAGSNMRVEFDSVPFTGTATVSSTALPSSFPVQRSADGRCFISVRNLDPSQLVVLSNQRS